MICFVGLSVFPSVYSGASPTTCSSTCVSRIHRDGRVEWCCRVTTPKCSATCFPCRLRAYGPCCRGSLMFWDCFSHTMMNPFCSAEEGKMSATFLSAILCGRWNHSVAMTSLDAFGCTDWAFPNHFCCYCKLYK